MVRDLSFLDPRKMATEPDAFVVKLKTILIKLANYRRVKDGDCDVILHEFQEFLDNVVVINRTRFIDFQPAKQE